MDVYRQVGTHTEQVPEATVTVNGVSLPRNERGSFTTISTPLSIGAGTRVELVAAAGATRLTYTFDCPDIVVTAPADGDTVELGDQVVASWSGTVRNYEGSIDTAQISLYNYDSTTGNFSGATSYHVFQNLDGLTQTATLPIPAAVDPGYDGLAVVLLVPGKPAVDDNHLAVEPYCDLNRRVILKVSR
jgi:hypothetical protein